MLGAINAAPREHGGDLRDADSKHLPGQDVVHALLQIRNLRLQSFVEPVGDLAQEHAGFGTGIEELHRLVRPDILAAIVCRPRLGQRIEHPAGKFRRGEHLVVGEVGDARQHVRVAAAQGKAGLLHHSIASGVAATSSLTVMGG